MAEYSLFIDTNILLDFYRIRNESGLKLLTPLDKLHDRLITTYQVEMEFKKNRHSAIGESLRNLKSPTKAQHAAFLADTTAATKLDDTIDDADKRVRKMRKRLERILAKPTTHDPVYRVIQRLFTNQSDLNLRRDNIKRRAVKRSAYRRFTLGYPPRKTSDTSAGDAFNWEWIITVAKDTGCHVIIVSRDSDFGTELDHGVYVNDWLIQEFRDRVAKSRQLKLYTRLSSALKAVNVAVTKETAEEEEKVAVAATQRRRESRTWPEIGNAGWVASYEKLLGLEGKAESRDDG
jgi:hypothetical protein